MNQTDVIIWYKALNPTTQLRSAVQILTSINNNMDVAAAACFQIP